MKGLGRIFAIVGPSGVGKDTLIEGVRKARPDLVVLRRVITRPSQAGGEAFEGVSEAEFDRRLAAGEFVLHWQAHGLRYGIPRNEIAVRIVGRDVLFNGSRAALGAAVTRFPDLVVLRVTAPEDLLRQRLLERGREEEGDIAARLRRASRDIPPGVAVIDIVNDGTVAEGIARLLAVLQPESGYR